MENILKDEYADKSYAIEMDEMNDDRNSLDIRKALPPVPQNLLETSSSNTPPLSPRSRRIKQIENVASQREEDELKKFEELLMSSNKNTRNNTTQFTLQQSSPMSPFREASVPYREYKDKETTISRRKRCWKWFKRNDMPVYVIFLGIWTVGAIILFAITCAGFFYKFVIQ